MALRIPTTQETVDLFIANLEAALNQTAPDTDKAFIKVLAAMEALSAVGLYRFAIERAKANLALTAGEAALEILGEEYGVTRKAAVAAQLDIQTAADPATTLPITASLTGDANSETYFPDAAYSESGGVIDATVVAQTPGIAGNLNVGDTLTLDEPITGVGNSWTVQDVAVLGTEQEDLEAYRRRVLLEIQTVGGGGNGVDYRTWAEETTGVFRAFPYAGAPVDTVVGFLDGDMEESGVSDWTAGNSATLTKETTTPQAGDQSLRIAYNAVNNPYAKQAALLVNRRYTVSGYARSDGSIIPSIRDGVSTVLWTGTASTDWQAFSVTFDAGTTDIVLYAAATGAGYVEFDSMDILQTSFPGDRSVFIEAETSIDPDGIATPALLAAARVSINTDPVTGKTRPPLGETDENLYIQSITRTTFNVQIRDLVVDADVLAETKANISTAVDAYLRGIAPFLQGTDPPASQNDTITDLTLSQVIQDVLNSVGGSAGGVGLFLIVNQFIPSYLLGQGELGKLGIIDYV
jgi:uncharacterized phage protein gp47/JayE